MTTVEQKRWGDGVSGASWTSEGVRLCWIAVLDVGETVGESPPVSMMFLERQLDSLPVQLHVAHLVHAEKIGPVDVQVGLPGALPFGGPVCF